MDSLFLINPFSLFSSRYRLFVRSTQTLNKYCHGFRLLLFKCLGTALQKCWRDSQDFNLTMIDLNFSPVFLSV